MFDTPTHQTQKDLSIDQLISESIHNDEACIAANGALSVVTGERTGRSPNDRFIVQDSVTADTVNWGKVNKPICSGYFDVLWERIEAYLLTKQTYVSHLSVGADKDYALPVTVINELAWHNVFVQNLFVRERLDANEKAWTILSAPFFKAVPERDNVNSEAAVIINFTKRKVLICGTRYAGEMKKAMFSVLNYLLTDEGVLPMHCAANQGKDGDVALFFGLSGTGKTTLSADPNRYLIGDDEHGWGDNGVFNFEGGCYAKCIDLSKEREPVIWDAIRRGAVMENVALDEKGQADFTDTKYTQNSRAAYPREHIEMRVPENKAGAPSSVIFLTCDLYGVLPPVSKLTREQAAYHFLSGYTALVGSTEMGHNNGIQPTFSTCFGAPFFPRPSAIYADILMKRIDETACSVYLVNTGWSGGGYHTGGKRFSIPVTRSIINAILSGSLKDAEYEVLPGFDLMIPTKIEGVDPSICDPRKVWKDSKIYQSHLDELMKKFVENFQQFDVDPAILEAGPSILEEVCME